MQSETRAYFKHRSFSKPMINMDASRGHERLCRLIRTLCVWSSSVCVLFCVFDQPLAGRRGRIIDGEGEEKEEQEDAGVRACRDDAPKSIKASCLFAFFLLLSCAILDLTGQHTHEREKGCLARKHANQSESATHRLWKAFNIVGSFAWSLLAKRRNTSLSSSSSSS